MENATILRQEEFTIKAPHLLTIGDPMYLQDIANGTTTGCEKDYIYDSKPYNYGLKEHILTVKEQTETIELISGEEITTGSIIVKIIGVSTHYSKENRDNIINTLKNDMYHEDLLEKEGMLGCDTAEFLLQTEKGCSTLATGGDGQYGYYIEYVHNIAYVVELAFGRDLYDFDTVIQIMQDLFDFL